ncbi:FRG domain-containing protein [Vibrio parahaemolyticus]
MENNITDNLASFIDKISRIPRKKDHTLFFRGHAKDSFPALPAIFRDIPKSSPPAKYIDKESQLFYNMVMQCPDEFKGSVSTFDYLVKMQHYSLPTRLLDITTNPLVALYFSCCEFVEEGHNGEVLVYQIPNNEIKFYNSDTVSIISNLAQINNEFNIDDDADRGKFIHIIKNEKPYFLDVIDKNDLSRVVCVQPKQDNRRIIKQSGAFLLFAMGSEFKKNTPAKIPSEYTLKEYNITIPCKNKDLLLASLEYLAISEATLFPEIDNVAKFLKKAPRAYINSAQNNFIVNNPKYIELIVSSLTRNDDLLESIRNNSKEAFLQSNLMDDNINEAVIETMQTHDEEATLLLSEPELIKEVVSYCYELLKNNSY